MSIEVQGPSGIIEFPDGTPPEVIKRKMREMSGGVAQGTAKTAAGKSEGFFDFLSGVDDSLTQGVTFGFADEVGAAGGATGRLLAGETDWGGNYSDILNEKRGKMHDFSGDHPIVSTAATLAGGFGVGGPAAGSSLPGTLSRLMGLGAGYSAVGGFGAAEGAGNDNLWEDTKRRLQGTAIGAGVGGVLGAALPMAAVATNKLVQTTKNLAGKHNPVTKAQDFTLRALRRDEVTPAQLRGNYNDKPEALVDQGENLIGLGDTVTQMPGVGRKQAVQFLNNRHAGSGDRVTGDVRKSIANADFYGTVENLQDVRRTTAKPLYDTAFAVGPVYSSSIQRFLKNPRIQEGIKRGMRIMRDEADAAGKPLNLADYAITGFDASGAPILGPVPTMRLLDAGKRGLDDLLNDYRNPTTGKLDLNEEGRAIEQLRKSYVNNLDFMNTDYKKARAAWAGPSQSMDAMWMGRRFARGDSEVIAKTYRDMSPSDQEFFKMGVVREIEGMVSNTKDGRNVVDKFFSAPGQRERLKVLFPSAAEYDAFAARMAQEQRMAYTRQETLGNSKTVRRQMQQQDAGALEAAAVDYAGTGNAKGVMFEALRRGMMKARGMDEATASEVAKLIFEADPQVRLGILLQLANRQKGKDSTAKRIMDVSGRALGATANLTGQKFAPQGAR